MRPSSSQISCCRSCQWVWSSNSSRMKGLPSPTPVRSRADVDRLRDFDSRESLGHVLETIRLLRTELASRVPLIGFGGAPFTLASYTIEGGPSSNYARTKAFMYAEPDAWHRLCGRFASMMIEYLRAQVEAGAQALQLFDSWAGALGRSDYREFAQPHTRRIFDELADVGVPLDSLRRRHFRDSPRSRRGRWRRHWRRLAPAARRSLGDDRFRSRHPGQSGSLPSARAADASARRSRRCAGAGRRTGRSHLQPGTRYPSQYASRTRADAGTSRSRIWCGIKKDELTIRRAQFHDHHHRRRNQWSCCRV